MPKKLLVANRGEIAIRVFRACSELNIRTVAMYSTEDRLALHRYKADEAYQLDPNKDPVAAYLDIEGIIQLAQDHDVDAIHPGYGFLSENADFADAVRAAGIIWIGPTPAVMRALGDKLAARKLAHECDVAVVPGSDGALETWSDVQTVAQEIGFPLILKAAGGGGGRGMSVVRQMVDLQESWERCRLEAGKAFGCEDVFVERFVENPRHIEVQIVGDNSGEVLHFHERDCSVQRRFQKIVEVAPCAHLPEATREGLFAASLKLARHVGYTNAGTMEFLVETVGERAGEFYFIEANARLQVEHTVTEWITGHDLVHCQIRIATGESLVEQGLGSQDDIPRRGFAIQCRINAEDASHDFAPQTGRITTWRSAAGMGVRLDSGGGDVNFEVGSHYDSLLCKVSTWGPTLEKAADKMNRALGEFRIRGVRTNIPFLHNVIRNGAFRGGDVNTSFVEVHPELFHFPPRLDRASKILYYLGDTVLHRSAEPRPLPLAKTPTPIERVSEGSREAFERLGRETFLQELRDEERLRITDTTLRDAHQSLFATRLRTKDMLPALAALDSLPLWSLEVWGGATFDVAYRFLNECPWERLEKIRAGAPTVLLQMLLRGSNVVGYRNQPDNLIKKFVKEARKTGVDVFRIFDALNYLPNLEVAIESVREEGGLAEVALCYTGNVADTTRTHYPLEYYVDLAIKMHEMGADLIAIKDMAGLLTPSAARLLIPALREAVPCPIHLHNHDTSSFGGATLLSASRCGVDVVDAAMGPMSGLTSQPNLGTLVATLLNRTRDTGMKPEELRGIDWYFQSVREAYSEFESGLKSGTSSVYWHEIPGGQYSNLLPQAKALGLENRWSDVLQAFSEANELMGDPVKVTPTSKAVGDLALFMVGQQLTPTDVRERAADIDWPQSVKDFFMGLMGQPHTGFDEKLQAEILGGDTPYTDRAGKYLEDVDFESVKVELYELLGRDPDEREILSHVLFPTVFRDYAKHQHRFGDTSILETDLFFHGVELNREVQINLEKGKTLIVKLVAIGEPDDRGQRPFHFELNGFPRVVMVRDNNLSETTAMVRQADPARPGDMGAPMPGKISRLDVTVGQGVEKGQTLFVIEAMKMETPVAAHHDGMVCEILHEVGATVRQDDLLVVLEVAESAEA